MSSMTSQRPARPSSPIASDEGDDVAARVLWAIEELRLAEARLVRRRQTSCGPSHNEREAMRLITERADDGEPITPTELAGHLGLTTPSVSAILKRLTEGGLVATQPHEADRRSKLLVPASRNHPDTADPLSPHIRALAADIGEHEAEVMAALLDKVRQLVDLECRD